jgi:hypothetical protein
MPFRPVEYKKIRKRSNSKFIALLVHSVPSSILQFTAEASTNALATSRFQTSCLLPPSANFLILTVFKPIDEESLVEIVRLRLCVKVMPPVLESLIKSKLQQYPNPLLAEETADQLKEKGKINLSHAFPLLVVPQFLWV